MGILTKFNPFATDEYESEEDVELSELVAGEEVLEDDEVEPYEDPSGVQDDEAIEN